MTVSTVYNKVGSKLIFRLPSEEDEEDEDEEDPKSCFKFAENRICTS